MPVTQTISVARPRRCDLFGVRVSATTYQEVIDWCIDRAHQGKGGIIDLMPVHGLISAPTCALQAARHERDSTVW